MPFGITRNSMTSFRTDDTTDCARSRARRKRLQAVARGGTESDDERARSRPGRYPGFDGCRACPAVGPCAWHRQFTRRCRRSGQDRHLPHHQRLRLLHRRRHGLLPRGRPRRVDHRVQLRRADDRAARHGRARCRRRHRVGGLLQRGRARHPHEDRGRSSVDQAGLRLFLPDGAQGPRRLRPLQDLRRSQRHEGRDRRAWAPARPRRSTRR